jgi:outer membrane protein insertion porin family
MGRRNPFLSAGRDLALATAFALGAVAPWLPALQAAAQDPVAMDQDLVDRPIVEVRVEGLHRVDEQKVRNVLRTQAGSLYDRATLDLDLRSLVRLGDFRSATYGYVQNDDGTLIIIFRVEEQPLLAGVQVVDNYEVSDQALLEAIPLSVGVPRDEYLINTSRERILEIYRDRGHYLAEVFVESEPLEEAEILIFRIVEGPRVRIREIVFQGNVAFTHDQLKRQIQSEEAVFLFKQGRLDPERVTADVASIDRFYKERGYLDVRVGHLIEISPNQREARIEFVIEEGPVYTMREVTANGSTLLSREEIAAILEIKPGDVYSQDQIRKSLTALRDTYGEMGYVDADVDAIEIRVGEGPQVDLLMQVDEGPGEMLEDNRFLARDISIVDNFLTQDRVILRHLDFAPNRPISMLEIAEAERELRATRLFSNVNIVVQDEDPAMPGYRDIVVDIDETNTGSVNFGVAVGSDSGVFGDFSINQRNFDIEDFPESWGEFVNNRAFRGAGQQFSLQLQPGNEVSRYAVSLTEPALMDSVYGLTLSTFFREWQFEVYDEERFNGTVGLTRRLGDYWRAGVSSRYEQVHLTAIAPFAPTEVFAAEGPDTITSIGFQLTRSTVDTIIRPGRGSVLEMSIERVGALGGDYDFTSATVDYTVFLTLDEDFLGRKSILRLKSRVSHIFEDGEAPVYEQFYLGGRSFRGFDFRTISPKGIRNDNGKPSEEPVGGEWLIFLGAQYEFPIWEELFNGVIFADTGTVTDEVGFDDYRASVGVGLRLYVEAFGPVPIAFDFGFPILSEDTDEEQVFSFSAEIPF